MISRRVLWSIGVLSLPYSAAVMHTYFYARENRDDRSIVVAGTTREFTLHIPDSYDPRKPTALVLSFHGAGLWGQAQRRISQWDRLADNFGFIVAYPSGLGGHGTRVWKVSGEDPAQNRDVQFVRALIDTLAAQYNIDRKRIYANGLSNGGGMAFMLSCTMRDEIAAFGLVGAAITMNPQLCRDTRPAPAIVIHGTKDDAALYGGGPSWVAPDDRPFPSIPGFVRNWARRNRCSATPTESRVAADVTLREYSHCANSADVAFYTIEGGGHTWPGGGYTGSEAFLGKTTMSIDASSVMWAFFKQHPLAK